MEKINNVTEFIFRGLFQNPEVEAACFVVFSFFYTVIFVGNLLIILTIFMGNLLKTPMYFFLNSLSFVDICFSLVTAPKMIVDLLAKNKTISFVGYMLQVFGLHFFGKILLGTWVSGFLHSIIQVTLIVHLAFCRPNEIDHYFCDVRPVLKLACTDTYVIGAVVTANSGTVTLGSFVFLLISYSVILVSLRKQSTKERRKALSTCSTHIAVVIIFFGPCVFTYMHPYVTFSEDKMVAVFYTIITPMLNSMIYTLRNAEVKNAMRKLWNGRFSRMLMANSWK
ncbi:Olfactory receptor 4S2 [Sciurus carolinensis]|uniref:Olfactory receptor 4S2 n=1 Tax=Sciurus carolinensis TaxID=30640 RepID=A0AA41NHM4_SCICA|nr:Olfactory receptor 4S2 [Sciurus carolinensis]